MIHDSFLKNQLISVLPPQKNGQYTGRICVAGKPTIIQSYDNGELDIVITGIMKCKLTAPLQKNPYLIYDAEPIEESYFATEETYEDLELFKDFIWRFVNLHPTLKNQAKMIENLLIDPESIINYTTLLLVSDPLIKTKVMEASNLEDKTKYIKLFLGPKTIELGPFLPPIHIEENNL